MRQMFSFNRFSDETANDLVLAFNALVDLTLDNKNNTDEYKEANKLFSENLVQYCMEGTGLTYNSLEDIKNPMVYSNVIFQSRFNTILAQAITPAVPTVAASGYDQLFEVHQVGFGVAKAVSAC